MTDQTTYQISDKNPRVFYGYYIVAIALLVMFLGYGVRTIFGVFFKPMLEEFEWTRALVSGSLTLSMIAQGLWGIVMGRWNDKIGPRPIITLCCVLLGLGFLLMSRIEYLWQMYLFYGIIIGFGMGGIFVVLLSTVARWFFKRRGTMIGIVLTGMGLGSLIMSPVATWLISIFDWRTSYMIVGGAVLVVGTIMAQFLKRDPTALGLKPYGQTEVGSSQLQIDKSGLSLSESVRRWQFWLTAAIFSGLGYCLFTALVHIVPHVTDIGISPTVAGYVLALMGAGNIIGGVFLGNVADRIGNKYSLVICLTLMAAATFVLVQTTEIWLLSLCALLIGIGNGGSGVTEPTLVAELFGLKSHGLILGIISFSFTIGGAVGPLVTGHLFDLNGNYMLAFLVSGGICVCSLVLTLFLKPVAKNKVGK